MLPRSRHMVTVPYVRLIKNTPSMPLPVSKPNVTSKHKEPQLQGKGKKENVRCRSAALQSQRGQFSRLRPEPD